MLTDNVEAEFLSTEISGGFVGCMYAIYAISIGKSWNNAVAIDWFEYTGDYEIYR